MENHQTTLANSETLKGSIRTSGPAEMSLAVPSFGSSRADSAMMVMFSRKPTGSLLGQPQAGAYINSFPFQTHILCPPLRARTWGSSPEFPSPFSSLSNLSSYTVSPPHRPSDAPQIWPPSLFPLSIFQPPAGAEVTISLLYSLPGPVLGIDGIQGYPCSLIWRMHQCLQEPSLLSLPLIQARHFCKYY